MVPANWFSLGIEGALRFRANSLKACIKSYCLEIYEEGAYEIPKIKKQYQTKMKKFYYVWMQNLYNVRKKKNMKNDKRKITGNGVSC